MPASTILNETLSNVAHLNLEGEVDPESIVRKASGGYSDVYVGSLRRSKLRVALKKIRAHLQDDDHLAKVCAGCFLSVQ